MATEEITHRNLADGSIAELAEALRGELIRPGDENYDEARSIWNGSIDRHPALIVRCAGVADVMRAVELRAQRAGCRWRCGRGRTRSPASRSATMGIVIDLSPMKGDPGRPGRPHRPSAGGR